MDANKFTYTLYPVSSEITGSANVWRAVVQANEVIGPEDAAKELASILKQDVALVKYWMASYDTWIWNKLHDGYRINTGATSYGFVIKGTFSSEDDRFDATRHQLLPSVQVLASLKSATAGIEPSNITQGLSCKVFSVVDNVTKESGIITGSHVLHIAGEYIGIDTNNADEGVTLVDAEGTVKATATVTDSSVLTIDCQFDTPPTPGEYTLVVSCRNGARTTLAPAVGKIKGVIVKAATEGGAQ